MPVRNVGTVHVFTFDDFFKTSVILIILNPAEAKSWHATSAHSNGDAQH